MIKVIESSDNTRDGMHCVLYPSPSALEACSVCPDKFRMEQIARKSNGGEYESTADAERGTVIHKACAILLNVLCRKESSETEVYTQLSLYEKSLDELNKIAGWSNEYWNLAYKSVCAVMCELHRMENQYGDVSVYIETVVNLDKFLNGYYGTADVVAVAGTEMLVADYKFGYRKVRAYENKQLTCYASKYITDDIKDVTYLIVQSSINHNDYYRASASTVKELMQKNLNLIKAVSNTDVIHSRCVSDTSCAYCNAKDCCSAYKNSNFADLIDAVNSDRELTASEKAKLYMLVNTAIQWQKSIRADVIKDINEGKCNDFYLKQNKDKESVNKDKSQEALEAIKSDMDDLLLEGAIDCEWKFNVAKLKEHYGADFEKVLGQYITRTAGNIVIKMREREREQDAEHS